MNNSSESSGPESRKRMRLADESAGELSIEVMANIFSFLLYYDIMPLREVCATWRDAAKETLVPLTEFKVNSVRKYNAMNVMSTALPYLQQLSLSYLGDEDKYRDGENAAENWARHTANKTTLDIEILSSFRKLRILKIYACAPLNGRYPVLFNFPLLQKLTIWNCTYLMWDLRMLKQLPLLKELKCGGNPRLFGNINSLRVLKDTLEKVQITNSLRVEGDFMDLADFPHLKELIVTGTNLRGDIRDIIDGHDFSALESLFLPKSVYGGEDCEIQNVADVPKLMKAIHHLLQRSPTIFGKSDLLSRAFNWRLSRRSPHWYNWDDEIGRKPPFRLRIVQAGSRRGWSWCAYEDEDEDEHVDADVEQSCKINWLDPEPSRESSDYEACTLELQSIEQPIDFYRGNYQPPTEEEYRRLM